MGPQTPGLTKVVSSSEKRTKLTAYPCTRPLAGRIESSQFLGKENRQSVSSDQFLLSRGLLMVLLALHVKSCRSHARFSRPTQRSDHNTGCPDWKEGDHNVKLRYQFRNYCDRNQTETRAPAPACHDASS